MQGARSLQCSPFKIHTSIFSYGKNGLVYDGHMAVPKVSSGGQRCLLQCERVYFGWFGTCHISLRQGK